jgi:hypothetical protein
MRQRIVDFFRPNRFKTTFFIVGMLIVFFVRFSSIPVDLDAYYFEQQFGKTIPAPAQLYISVVEAAQFPNFFLTQGEQVIGSLLCPVSTDDTQGGCHPFFRYMPVWGLELFSIVVNSIFIYLLACVLVVLWHGFLALTRIKNRGLKTVLLGGLTLGLIAIAVLYQLRYNSNTREQVQLVVRETAVIDYLETKVAGVKAGQDGKAFCGYMKYLAHQEGETLTQYLIARCRGYGVKDGKLVEGQTVTTPIVLIGKSAGEACKVQDNEVPCILEYGFTKPYAVIEHKKPETGNSYGQSVRKLFPRQMWQVLFNYSIFNDEIIEQRAKAHFQVS